MLDEPSSSQPGDPGGHSYFQNFQHTPVGARVPEKVGRGVFATALMVLQTNELFVLDLLSMTSQPQQVVGRIIMTANSFSQFLAALRLNVKHYESEIGPLKPRLRAAAPEFPADCRAVPAPAASLPAAASAMASRLCGRPTAAHRRRHDAGNAARPFDVVAPGTDHRTL